METAELWKLIDSILRETKEQTDSILDADVAELDIVHPNDKLNNKRYKIVTCKIVRKRLTEIYALVEKIEEREKVDIVNLEVLIDESML